MFDTILNLDSDLVMIMFMIILVKQTFQSRKLAYSKMIVSRRRNKDNGGLLIFCQTIYPDCQSSPVMSDVDNISVTGGGCCVSHGHLECASSDSEHCPVVSSSDMVTARRTIRNRIFYSGPFLDYHCFHQGLLFH